MHKNCGKIKTKHGNNEGLNQWTLHMLIDRLNILKKTQLFLIWYIDKKVQWSFQ